MSGLCSERVFRLGDGAGRTFLICPGPARAPGSWRPVSPHLVASHVDAWLADTSSRETLFAMTASLRYGYDGPPASDDADHLLHAVRPRILSALASGDLLVFEDPAAPERFPLHAEPEPRLPDIEGASHYALRVLDEVGDPISDIEVEIDLDGVRRALRTGPSGLVRVDGTRAARGDGRILDLDAVREALAPRWKRPRTSRIPTGANVDVCALDDLHPIGLVRGATVTLVLTPYFRCFEVPGAAFDFERSFPRSAVLPAIASIVAQIARDPGRRAMVFGHTDRTGSEEANKQLSERRAEAVRCLLSHDAERWAQLFRGDRSPLVPERWGAFEIQHMLNALGCGDAAGKPLDEDGVLGQRSSEALARFQRGAYPGRLPEQKALPATGRLDDATTEQLFLAYARRATPTPVAQDRFVPVGGSPFMGCGGFNPFTVDDSDAESRRAVVFVFDPAAEPTGLPCKIGDVGPCRAASRAPRTPADPTPPDERAPYRCGAYRSVSSDCPCRGGEPLQVLRIQLHDQKYDPAPNTRYRLRLPNGSMRPGETDGEGTLRCAVSRRAHTLEASFSPHPACVTRCGSKCPRTIRAPRCLISRTFATSASGPPPTQTWT